MNKTDQRQLAEQMIQQEFIKMINNAPEGHPLESLLIYGDPKVIAVQDRKGIFHPKYSKDDEDLKPLFEVPSVYRELRGRNQSEMNCTDKAESLKEIRSILNKVFPPQIWRDEGKIFRRFVSNAPASRSQVIHLQDKLDELMAEKKLKGTGLDETRRHIFDDCMNELARQEVINCPQRGLILLRIRDELRASLEGYESLYLSNAAYGIRKAIRVETDNESLNQELEKLQEDRQSQLASIQNIREQLQSQEEKYKQLVARTKRKYIEERDNLRRHNQNLKTQLESMVQGNRET